MDTPTLPPVTPSPELPPVETPALPSPKKRHTILWVTLGLTALLGGMAAASFLPLSMGTPVPIPTLELSVVTRSGVDLAARLVVPSPQGDVFIYSAAEARAGFDAPADSHILFTCPPDATPGIEVDVANGGAVLWGAVRSWGYEYSGNERANKSAGKKGRALFDGRFWLSGLERETSSQYHYLDTRDPDGSPMDMVGGKMYYLMIDGTTLGVGAYRVSCMDSDGDMLNDREEDKNGNGTMDADETDPKDRDSDDDGLSDGTEVIAMKSRIDPRNPDTDGDGIQDGTELGETAGQDPDSDPAVFIPDADPTTTTDPTKADTDGGGLSDGEEDVNRNGRVDKGEKDPNNPADDFPVACGDGAVHATEECDDANMANEDGCSTTCTVETGWSCDGEPSACGVLIPVFPAGGDPLGSLYVTQDSAPIPNRQLLAGAINEPILNLNFRATDEPVDVTHLVFTNLGSDTRSIGSLHLLRAGEETATAFAYATENACSGVQGGVPANSFCAVMESQQLVVPGGETVSVLVRPQLKSDEEGAGDGPGAVNNRVILLAILTTGYEAIHIPAIAARGLESGNMLRVNNGDSTADGEIIVGRSSPGPDLEIRGNENDTVLAKTTNIENVNPDPDGMSVPIGKNKRIARFKFTAAVNANTRNGRNKATIDGIVFTVASQNVDFADGFDLLNLNDQTEEIRCSAAALQGTEKTLVTCLRAKNPTVNLAMDSGGSVTLELQADIESNRVVETDPSSLQVFITNFSDRSLTTFGASPGRSHVRWSDTLGEISPVYFQWIEYGETTIDSTAYSI